MFAAVATPDLMLASRFTTAGPDVRPFRDEDSVLAAVADPDCRLVVVDLEGFPGLPPRVREVIDTGAAEATVLGFAPHVRVELLDEARHWCDIVVPRGRAISRFPKFLEDAGLSAYNQDATLPRNQAT